MKGRRNDMMDVTYSITKEDLEQLKSAVNDLRLQLRQANDTMREIEEILFDDHAE